MEIIFLIAGFLIGVLIMRIRSKKERIDGIIYIDHKTEQCKFQILTTELSDRKKKIAVFYIDHDSEISQE